MQKLTKEQKAFLDSPSKLSSGTKNKRFKGTIKSNFYLKECSDQSGLIQQTLS